MQLYKLPRLFPHDAHAMIDCVAVDGLRQVSITNRLQGRTLAASATTSLHYRLDGKFRRFVSRVAIDCGDSGSMPPFAHFFVRADGIRVAQASFVRAGEDRVLVEADISGARELELTVATDSWSSCRPLWIEPRVDNRVVRPPPDKLQDCLGVVWIDLPHRPLVFDRCIATVASRGFAPMLSAMLDSLARFGGCSDVPVIVALVDADEECEAVARRHGTYVIRCRSRRVVDTSVKSVLYSIARVVDAQQFLCLDADTLILRELRSIFSCLEALPAKSILACREENSLRYANLGQVLAELYGGKPNEVLALLGTPRDEEFYPFVINDGVFAASQSALLAADALLRTWTKLRVWMHKRRENTLRNQFLFNLVLAHLQCGVELSPHFNVQLNCQDVVVGTSDGVPCAHWRGELVHLLHFNGYWGRGKYEQTRKQLGLVPQDSS